MKLAIIYMTIAGTHPEIPRVLDIWVHVRHVPVVFGLEQMQHTVAIEKIIHFNTM